MKKSQLAIIKNRTFQLRVNRQLPLKLTQLIYDLNGKEETKYVQFLLQMSEHFLRVKWYYKKYPMAEKEAEEVITDGLHKLGF